MPLTLPSKLLSDASSDEFKADVAPYARVEPPPPPPVAAPAPLRMPEPGPVSLPSLEELIAPFKTAGTAAAGAGSSGVDRAGSAVGQGVEQARSFGEQALGAVDDWIPASWKPPTPAPASASAGPAAPYGVRQPGLTSGPALAPGAAPAAGGAQVAIDRSSPAAFLGSFVGPAAAALQAKGYPTTLAPILAAIPMNEQGWQQAAPGNNYFGIKGCFDAKTEALTGRGWVPWPQVRPDDVLASPDPATGRVDYQRPTRLIRYRHAGPMYRLISNEADLLVTPDHRLWVRSSGSRGFRLMAAHEVAGRGAESLAVHAVPLHGRVARVALQPVAPLGLHVGKVLGLGAQLQVLGTHARRVVAAVHDLLVRRQRDPVGKLIRHPMGAVHAAQLANLAVVLRVPGGDPDPARAKLGGVRGDRSVPIDLGPEALLARAEDRAPAGTATPRGVAKVDLPRIGEEFVPADLAGARDGTFGGHRSHSFGVTAPARSNGRGALVRSNCIRSEGWVAFEGMVYCATVPNGLLIVRRNGKATVSGNSNPRTGANTGPVGTWEDYGGGRTNISDTFRAYDSPTESVGDFLSFLESNPRYAQAVKVARETGDPVQFIKAVHAAGYATDPAWSDKVLSIARTVPAPASASTGATAAMSMPAAPPVTGGASRLQGITPPQFGLGDADAEAICGPVLMMAFATSNGRNPTIDEAKQIAAQHGGWTAGAGMGGPEGTARALRAMGVPATYHPGALDLDRIRQETANGNPVGINTPGHYFVVEGVDDRGRLDLGNSAKALRASGGRQWFTPQEIAGLGMGAPTGAIYKDAPSSPSPSGAVKETGLRPVYQPTAIVTPDTPAQPAPVAFQAPTGRAGGGVTQMLRAPVATAVQDVASPVDYDPRDADGGAREIGYGAPAAAAVAPVASSYNDPTAGGTIAAPLPPVLAPPPAPSYNDVGAADIRAPQGTTDGGTIQAPLPPAPPVLAPPVAAPVPPIPDQVSRYVPSYAPQAAQVTAATAPTSDWAGVGRSIASTVGAGIEAAAPVVTGAVPRLIGMAPPETAEDVIWANAPAPVRAISAVSRAGQAFGAGAGRQATAELGGGAEPTLGGVVPDAVPLVGGADLRFSPQDVGAVAGSIVADPTNWVLPGTAADAAANAAIGNLAGAATRPVARALGRAGEAVGGWRAANAERVAAADARMAPEGATGTLGTFGVAPGGQNLEARIAAAEARLAGSSEYLERADGVLARAADTGTDAELREARRAYTPARAAYDEAADALEQLRAQRREVSRDIEGAGYGRPVEDAGIDTSAVPVEGPSAYPGRPDVVPPFVDDAPRGGFSLNAGLGTAGPLPPGAAPDRLASVNRALGQGIMSSVSGGVGAQVNQEMNPDDPYAAAKGFAAGALVPPLAARGAGALARRVGAGERTAEGALAALGNVPPGPAGAAGRAVRAGVSAEAAPFRLRPGNLPEEITPSARPAEVPSGGTPPRPEPSLPEGARPITLTPEQEAGRLRLEKFPEDLRPTIQQAAEDAGWYHTQRRGVLPDDVVKNMADGAGSRVEQALREAQMGRGPGQRAWSAEESSALRNAVAGQTVKVNDLAAAVQGAGTADAPSLVGAFTREAARLTDLVGIMEGARAEAGRTLRQWGFSPRVVDQPDAFAQAVIKKFGGDTQKALGVIAEYNQLVRDGKDPIQLAGLLNRVMADPANAADWFALYRRFNMLSGPRTFEVNALSGGLELAYDTAQRAGLRAVTGHPGEAGEILAAPIIALRRAGKNFGETLAHGITTEQAARGDLPRSISSRMDPGAGRNVAQALETPDRINAATDQFTRTLAEQMILTDEALKATRGMPKDARAERMAELMADPTKDMLQAAADGADRITFQGDLGELGKGLRAVQKVPFIGNVVLPFLTTVYKITERGLDRSPVGALTTAQELIRSAPGISRVGKGAYRAGIERPSNVPALGARLRDNAIGMGAGMVAYNLAETVDDTGLPALTGMGPDDPEKRAELRALGWQPYSVRIGGQYHSYANLGPFAFALAQGAAAAEAQRYAKDDATTAAMIGDAAKRFGSMVTESSVVSGIGALVKAQQDPERYGTQWLTQALQTFVPAGSLLNTVGQMTDPTVRRAERDDLATQVEQGVTARIPVLRQAVPAAQDPLGRDIQSDQTGLGALIPTRPTTVKDDPAIQMFLDAQKDIPKPHDEIGLGKPGSGLKIALTPAEQRAWSTARGQVILEASQELQRDPDWSSAPREVRAKILDKVLTAAARAADGQALETIGDEEIDRRLEAAQRRTS